MEQYKITYRHTNLQRASKALGQARSKEGCAYALLNSATLNSPGPKRHYNINGLDDNASKARHEADRYLRQSCGSCALRTACKLADNLPAWELSHPVAGPNHTTEHGQETRKGMLARLNTKTTIDHTEPCDPAAINPTKIPTKQLTLDV